MQKNNTYSICKSHFKSKHRISYTDIFFKFDSSAFCACHAYATLEKIMFLCSSEHMFI